MAEANSSLMEWIFDFMSSISFLKREGHPLPKAIRFSFDFAVLHHDDNTKKNKAGARTCACLCVSVRANLAGVCAMAAGVAGVAIAP
jgi:hypothetical protein